MGARVRTATGWVAAGFVGAVVPLLLVGSPAVAFSVPNNSVTSAKIVDGSIQAADLANGSVNSSKIANGSIVNADLSLSVRNDLTTGIEVFEQTWEPGPNNDFSHSPDCDPGMRPLAGGGIVADANGDELTNVYLVASMPRLTDWLLLWYSDNGVTVDPDHITGWVTCAPV